MKTLYYFRYIIQYWDECCDNMVVNEGVVAGHSIGEVTKRLLHCYGDEDTEKLTVECVPDEEDVFVLKEYSLDGEFLKDKTLS